MAYVCGREAARLKEVHEDRVRKHVARVQAGPLHGPPVVLLAIDPNPHEHLVGRLLAYLALGQELARIG